MKLRKRRNRSNVTPDVFDSLQTLWDRFATGFICLDDEDDDLLVNCPFCNEDYIRGRGQHIFCDECCPGRKRPPHGLRLTYA